MFLRSLFFLSSSFILFFTIVFSKITFYSITFVLKFLFSSAKEIQISHGSLHTLYEIRVFP